MFCNSCGAAISVTASSCIQCGQAVAPAPLVPGRTSLQRTYTLGRFYAGMQIAGGLLLLLFLMAFRNHLSPQVRQLLLIAVSLALPLGYGLWIVQGGACTC